MAIFRTQVKTRARASDVGLQAFLLSVYRYMGFGLGLTGIVAVGLGMLSAGSQPMVRSLSLLCSFATLGIALYMGFGARRISLQTSRTLFWTYAGLMGGSLSYIFSVYHLQTIASAFFVTAATFGAMSVYGHSTQRSLESWGSFLRMGLFGIIFAMLGGMLAQMIFGANMVAFNFAINVLTVVVFVGLVAYDTQRLRDVYYAVGADHETREKMAVYGALTLYLNVINIFMALLRLLGGNDRRS
jgi:uncharacterized protein